MFIEETESNMQKRKRKTSQGHCDALGYKDTSITGTSSSEKIYYTLYSLCLLQDQQHVMALWTSHA